jgi:ParB family chromosome partitioning protein
VARRSGLGKGLGALIPTEDDTMPEPASGEASGAILREVSIAAVAPNRHQPRKAFDEESLAELAASIGELGVLQPILVRQGDDDQFELIAGERRWRAAQLAGLTTIPAVVRPAGDAASLEQALVENLHRDDLNPLEEAAAYQQLVDEFDLTQEQVATRVGKSRSAVANTVRLLQLPAPVLAMVGDGRLSAGHARALLATRDRSFQRSLAERIVAEGMTVRQVEEVMRSRFGDAEAEGSPGDEADKAAPAASGSSVGQTRPAALLELEELLSEYLQTRVRVHVGAKKGRVEIEFADIEDLERIYLAMAHPVTAADG